MKIYSLLICGMFAASSCSIAGNTAINFHEFSYIFELCFVTSVQNLLCIFVENFSERRTKSGSFLHVHVAANIFEPEGNELVALTTFMSDTPNQLMLLRSIIWLDSECRKLWKYLATVE